MIDEATLKTLREKLEAERRRLRELISGLEGETAADLSEGSDDRPLGNAQADVGSDLFEREQSLGLEQDFQGRIEEIEHALRKIDEGKYGVSEQSGDPIPVERLMVIPWARYNVNETGQ